MRLFDTHCHIADECFDQDLAEVVARFREAGVARALVVADPREKRGDDGLGNEEKVFGLAEGYDFLYGAVGVHPHNA